MAKKDFSSVFTFSIRQDITDSRGQPMGQSIIFYRLLLASPANRTGGFLLENMSSQLSAWQTPPGTCAHRPPLEQIFKAGIRQSIPS